MSPGLARWLVLLDLFRVGAWVIPRVPGCVFIPRACALGCPARPFQGRLHTPNGPQPGMPANITIGMDRGRLPTVRPLRLIRRSLGTITRRIATVSSVGGSQRTARRFRATIGIGIGIAIAIGIDIDILALPTLYTTSLVRDTIGELKCIWGRQDRSNFHRRPRRSQSSR